MLEARSEFRPWLTRRQVRLAVRQRLQRLRRPGDGGVQREEAACRFTAREVPPRCKNIFSFLSVACGFLLLVWEKQGILLVLRRSLLLPTTAGKGRPAAQASCPSRYSAPSAPHSRCSPPGLTVAAAPRWLQRPSPHRRSSQALTAAASPTGPHSRCSA